MHIIGNITKRKELDKIIKSNSLLHSYLFFGKDGIGKKIIAKDFAKKILCEKNNGNCECKSCKCFEANNHPDFQIINEQGDNITINQIRDLIKNVYEKPILSTKKIYIINDADKMNAESQNCLLKTLEEPPEYICFILIVSNIDMILSTIKSRCNKINFNKLTTEELNQALQGNNIDTKDISEKMYVLFDGSVGKALNVLENKDIYSQIDDFFNMLDNSNKIDFLTKGKSLFIKENIYEILEYCISIFFYYGKKNKNIRYLNCESIVQQAINNLKRNCNYDMSIDKMLYQIWEEVNENDSWS